MRIPRGKGLLLSILVFVFGLNFFIQSEDREVGGRLLSYVLGSSSVILTLDIFFNPSKRLSELKKGNKIDLLIVSLMTFFIVLAITNFINFLFLIYSFEFIKTIYDNSLLTILVTFGPASIAFFLKYISGISAESKSYSNAFVITVTVLIFLLLLHAVSIIYPPFYS